MCEQVFGDDVQFAPLGLLDMYNSGGAVEAVESTMNVNSECIIKIKARGIGRFGAYSSIRPKRCMVDMKEEEFSYNAKDQMLIMKLEGQGNLRDIEFVY